MTGRVAEGGEDAGGASGVVAVGGVDRDESGDAGQQHGGGEAGDHAVQQRAADLPRLGHGAERLAAHLQLHGEPGRLEARRGGHAQRAGPAEGPRDAADLAAAGQVRRDGGARAHPARQALAERGGGDLHRNDRGAGPEATSGGQSEDAEHAAATAGGGDRGGLRG